MSKKLMKKQYCGFLYGEEEIILPKVEVLSDDDLLSIILEEDVKLSLESIMYSDVHDFTQFGLSVNDAFKLRVLSEITRRIWRNEMLDKYDATFDTPMKIANFVKQDLRFLKNENVRVLFFNKRQRLIDYEDITKGSSDASILCPKDIIRDALKRNECYSIAVCHNHPSGTLYPSQQDVLSTRNLKTACEVMDLQLIDHIIIAGDSYFSFVEEGSLMC